MSTEKLPPMMTPARRREQHPGLHETYVFGQQRADGTACIGCPWETHRVLYGTEAVDRHDEYWGTPHDHSLWVPRDDGTCPCGRQPDPAAPDLVPRPDPELVRAARAVVEERVEYLRTLVDDGADEHLDEIETLTRSVAALTALLP